MSNRTLFIGGAGAVLLLVAIASLLMPDVTDPAVAPQDAQPQQVAKPPPQQQPVVRLAQAPAVIDAGAVHPADAGAAKLTFEVAPVQGEATLSEEQLLPAVVAVQRVVAQCSADMAARYPPPHELTLSFEVRADGEFATLVQPIVESSSIQDPHFRACVEDAPLDVQVPISAVGTARVRLPFRYGRGGE